MKIHNSYETRAWIIWYMFPIQCEELRINCLTLFLVVTLPFACWFLWQAYCIEDFKRRRLHIQFGVAFWRVVWRERYVSKGQIAFEGHWRLQSWTLVYGISQIWSRSRLDMEWSGAWFNNNGQHITPFNVKHLKMYLMCIIVTCNAKKVVTAVECLLYDGREMLERMHRARGCTVYYVWEPRAFMTPLKNPMIYERLYV